MKDFPPIPDEGRWVKGRRFLDASMLPGADRLASYWAHGGVIVLSLAPAGRRGTVAVDGPGWIECQIGHIDVLDEQSNKLARVPEGYRWDVGDFRGVLSLISAIDGSGASWIPER